MMAPTLPEGALRLQSGKAGPAALAGEKPLPSPYFPPTLFVALGSLRTLAFGTIQ